LVWWKSFEQEVAAVMLELIKTFAPDLELKYNKFYIGLAKDGQPNNFAVFRPKKNSFRVDIHLKSSPDIDRQLEEAGIEVMDYEKRWGSYRLRLTKAEIKKHAELLLKLLKLSYGIDIESATSAKAKV
jgi:hypothetical protein